MLEGFNERKMTKAINQHEYKNKRTGLKQTGIQVVALETVSDMLISCIVVSSARHLAGPHGTAQPCASSAVMTTLLTGAVVVGVIDSSGQYSHTGGRSSSRGRHRPRPRMTRCLPSKTA
ncbi:hypothetical protein PoB_002523000 [Plakobranchus ocellatus]|uniref:Uncharacterized protein n=1 Tax=Plakobranchus ocellatus TaxID=259542 RepID=A0AAV3ZVR8_9GAST|nr:hypothetical protein PoB_002523000 [Plakobranchus ocellatus]